MPSMKAIKRRISSVRSTEKIMKAMNMVAASKLQRARARLAGAREMYNSVTRIVGDMRHSEEVEDNVFIRPREVKNTAYVVITSDRGLCGSYNHNVSEKALGHMREGRSEKILAVGVRGHDFFVRRGKNILKKYTGVSETAFYEDAEQIGNYLESLYLAGEVDEVYVVYTRFESTLSYLPCIEKILPIAGEDPEEKHRESDMRFEPDASSFLQHMVGIYISAFIFAALVESSACEQASRMVSMDAATNNTAEIIDDFTRMYNRKRQAAITQEISEIVRSVSIME